MSVDMRRVFWLVLLLTASVSEARASLFIDDISTVNNGQWELEFTGDYYKDVEKTYNPDTEEFDKSVSKETWITSWLAYGLTERWDASITTAYSYLNDGSAKINGFSDVGVSTKYRFWEETKKLPAYAFWVDLKTRSANEDKGLGTGELDVGLTHILSKEIAGFGCDLNLGYIFVGGKPKDITTYSFGITKGIGAKAGVCAEIYGETIYEGDFDDNVFILGLSAGYDLLENVALQAGVGAGLSKASPDWQYSTRVTFAY